MSTLAANASERNILKLAQSIVAMLFGLAMVGCSLLLATALGDWTESSAERDYLSHG
jgi:hypothetical protein